MATPNKPISDVSSPIGGGTPGQDLSSGGSSSGIPSVSSYMNYGSYSGADIKVIVHMPAPLEKVRALKQEIAALKDQQTKNEKALSTFEKDLKKKPSETEGQSQTLEERNKQLEAEEQNALDKKANTEKLKSYPVGFAKDKEKSIADLTEQKEEWTTFAQISQERLTSAQNALIAEQNAIDIRNETYPPLTQEEQDLRLFEFKQDVDEEQANLDQVNTALAETEDKLEKDEEDLNEYNNLVAASSYKSESGQAQLRQDQYDTQKAGLETDIKSIDAEITKLDEEIARLTRERNLALGKGEMDKVTKLNTEIAGYQATKDEKTSAKNDKTAAITELDEATIVEEEVKTEASEKMEEIDVETQAEREAEIAANDAELETVGAELAAIEARQAAQTQEKSTAKAKNLQKGIDKDLAKAKKKQEELLAKNAEIMAKPPISEPTVPEVPAGTDPPAPEATVVAEDDRSIESIRAEREEVNNRMKALDQDIRISRMDTPMLEKEKQRLEEQIAANQASVATKVGERNNYAVSVPTDPGEGATPEEKEQYAADVKAYEEQLAVQDSEISNLNTTIAEDTRALGVVNQTLNGQVSRVKDIRDIKSAKQAEENLEIVASEIKDKEDKLKALLEAPNTKVLGELQSLSWSIFREKAPVRPLGSVYPRGYVRGPRTIGGTMVFTVFHKHALHELLESNFKVYSSGTSDNDIQQNTPTLPDQLPPLDISLMFANEYGAMSYMGIYGVEFVQEGGTFSIEDIFSENIVQYVARDLDPMTCYALATRNAQGPMPDAWTTDASRLVDGARQPDLAASNMEGIYTPENRRNPFI